MVEVPALPALGDPQKPGMALRPRYAKGGTEEVVGYAVRMPAQKNLATGTWEKAVWYGGGQLSKDLTLSALRDWAGCELPHIMCSYLR